MSQYEHRMVWRQNNQAVAEDAIALWHRLGILHLDTSPRDRASQLAIATYDGNSLAAVAGTVCWLHCIKR